MLGNERVVYREGKHKIGQWVLIAFPSSTHPFIKYFISDESDLAQVLSLHYKPLIVVIK
jgi:hypothetical protein